MIRWFAHELGYCANVHPGITPSEIETHLRTITGEVRKARNLPRMFAGLWLCESAADEYLLKDNVDRLKKVLNEHSLSVVTLNGFPQNNFHQPVVKQSVYSPTWAAKERLNYTVNLAHILAACMPEEETQGTISTLPLGYRIGWNSEQQSIACKHLIHYAKKASAIEARTGKHIRLCLEMEPGCVLETSDQLVHFFTHDLARAAQAERIDISLLERYLGVCYDVCHQAVMQESPVDSLGAIAAAGIRIGKIQISSALVAQYSEHKLLRPVLVPFAEQKYLHQVTTYNSENVRVFLDDLSDAWDVEGFPTERDWYIHYHLPIQCNDLPDEGLTTTQNAIVDVCEFLTTLDYKPHLEIETYTWTVLPVDKRPKDDRGLIQGLAHEQLWLEALLRTKELLA